MRAGIAPAAVLLLLVIGAGCRMATPEHGVNPDIHSPEDLAHNQQEVRLRIRALVQPLSGIVLEAADRVVAGATNQATRRAGLLWKIEAIPALREALFRPNPYRALMDTWVLSWQMTDYFDSGPGKESLGGAAPIAVAASQAIENRLESVAATLTHSGNVSDAREFARKWARDNPIQNAINTRETLLSRVSDHEIEETLATREVAMSMLVSLDDLMRRMDVYTVQLVDQSRWQAELFTLDLAAEYRIDRALPLAEQAAQTAAEAVGILKQITPAVSDALTMAQSAPDLISRERAIVIQAAQQEITRSQEFVQKERTTVLRQLQTELRQTVSEERALLTADVERIGFKLVDHAFLRLAQFMGAVLVLLFLGSGALLFIGWRLFVKGGGSHRADPPLGAPRPP